MSHPQSMYEKLAANIVCKHVKCQYDMEAASFNQCSWFAFCMCNALKDNNWVVPSANNLCTMYHNALNQATQLRTQYGQVSWGESIFSRVIHDIIPLTTSVPKVTILNEYNNPNGENLIFVNEMKQIHEFKQDIEREPFVQLITKLKHTLSEPGYMILNRYGQSFLIYPNDQQKETFYIFDSHCRSVGIFTLKNVIEYIKEESDDSYNFIIWIVGYKCDGTSNDAVKNKFLFSPL